MAHHNNNRRNLASSDPNPKTSMDPTHKKHPYTTTTTTTSSTTKPHPTHPDPTTASSTIHTISNHFSRLYTNHKVLSSLKPSNPPSKPMTLSATIEDTSTTTFKKANHQRRPAIEKDKKWSKKSLEGHDIKIAFERGKTDEVKKLWKKDSKKKESHEGHDMEIAFERGKTDEVKKLGKKDSKKKESHEGYDVKRSFVSLSRSQDFELKESHSLSLAMGGGGRRRSFCNSQTELADFLACNGVKIVSVDMPPFMQVHAVNCARKTCDSLEKFAAKTLAFTLKKEFDGVYGPAWHCIVGTSFGSFVTHSVGGFLYFSMDHKLYILLFKTTVQKAD